MFGLSNPLDVGFAAALTRTSPASLPLAARKMLQFDASSFDAVVTGQPTIINVGARDVRNHGVSTPVPVLRLSPKGQRTVESWPCITYECVGLRLDMKRKVSGNDPIKLPVDGTYLTVIGNSGDELVGAAQRKVRPHPLPYVLSYDIGIWSVDHAEVGRIMSSVLESLPAADGCLPIVWADGTAYDLAMWLASVVNIDEPRPHLSAPSSSRKEHWVLSYLVETWMDTSLATTLERTITNLPEFTLTRLPPEESDT